MVEHELLAQQSGGEHRAEERYRVQERARAGRADQIDAAVPGDEGQQAGKESRIEHHADGQRIGR